MLPGTDQNMIALTTKDRCHSIKALCVIAVDNFSN